MPAAHDPYRTLGVPRGATKADIKAAHRKLAKRFHPDASNSSKSPSRSGASKADARRFLEVQEAYRVLSDPLLRREWDAQHAPGPVSARQQGAPRPRPAPRTETTRARTRRAPAAQAAQTAADTDAQPRSSRAYTWSAAEVPWWEEGIKRAEARSAQEKSAREKAARGRPTRSQSARQAQAAESAESEPPTTAAPDFEVYNRSSGAAWSMAARAYFRKGDSDLPSRGVFRHEGGMPVTAGRARAAARAETERRAAEAANGSDAQRSGGEVRPPRGDK
jgi:curved DNA-binding protein CbpA